MAASGGLIPGCGAEATESETSAPGEKLGQASQALSPTCVTIVRGGPGGVADTRLRQDTPTTAYGAVTTVVTGDQSTNRITLISFDLTPIPAGAVITSADVTLDEVLNQGPSTVNVHAATAAWSEATVTWNSFNNAYAAAASTSFSNGGAAHTGPISFSLASLVQGWVNGAANNGIALLAPTNSTWSSSEAAIAAQRPSLAVCYLPSACAAPEVCDGLDNNCDGQVDEGFNLGAPCTAGVGACLRHGVIACNSRGAASCNAVPGAPTAESCDGVDNDCNGVIDDNLPAVICGVGACQRTGPACVNGLAGACVPGAPSAETCDGVDNDCDGVVDNGNPGGNVACGTGHLGVCSAGTTACASGGIVCNQNVQPSAQLCNGLDENCDGVVDEGCNCLNGTTQPCYGGAAGTQNVGVCRGGTQTCVGGNFGACVGQVLPSTEICDGLDNDCNGSIDDGLGTLSCGVGQCGRTVAACVSGHAGTCTPGAPTAETCDGLDNDCDGVVDNGNPGSNQACSTGLLGVCSAGTTACTSGAIHCNQSVASSAEACDGLDNNCNGTIDEGVKTTYYRDADGDGFGDPGTSTQACTKPTGYVTNNTDCNDASAAVHPGAVETCNGLDDNCNGQTDEGNPGSGLACGACSQGTTVCSGGALQCTSASAGLSTYYRDADGDGYGDAAITTLACSQPGGYVTNYDDCDDGHSAVNPGAAEVCDGLDNNCDGQIDEGSPGGGAACGACSLGTTVCSGGALSCTNGSAGLRSYYPDADGDGYGDVMGTPVPACSPPSGYVLNHTDCNDGKAMVHPGAAELCNGVDDNCDGTVDGPSAPAGAYTANSGSWTLVAGGSWEGATKSGWTDLYTQLGVFNPSSAQSARGSWSMVAQTATAFSGSGYALTHAVSVTAGQPYVLSGFFYTQGATSGDLYLDLNDVSFDVNMGVSMNHTGWQFMYRQFIPNVSSVLVRLVRDGSSGPVFLGQPVYIDEVAVTPLSQFVPPTRKCGPVSL